MNIKIGEVIKRLRKKQDVTQEKLAEYLGISYQAISKWENGVALPDITLVPTIANFFDVSIDELFTQDEQNKDEKIKEYENENKRLRNIGDMKGSIQLMREALKEYPKNYQLTLGLANSLRSYNATDEQEKESKEKGYIEEAIALCERILEDCTNDEIRQGAIQILCYSYPEFDKKERAIELANLMPNLCISKEKLLEHIYSGDDRIKQIQENILSFLNFMSSNLLTFSYGKNLSLEEKIQCVEAAKNLYNVIFYDDNTLFYSCRLRRIYCRLAELSCAIGKCDNGIKYLKLAEENAKKFDNLKESTKYTSLFVNQCSYNKSDLIKNFESTDSELLYERTTNSVFACLHEKKEFIEIQNRLKS
ncbi:helix-turn-helix transcriptional regulator [Mycoplasmatota bacterium]|nr:helix-turn-helix transcriptional regulator [Mycoplasmatota bacterium]